MAPMIFTSTLLEKMARGTGTASFRFSRPQEYSFQAGQFFLITIPSPDGPLTHQFSHSDSPTEGHIELTPRLTGSPFKNALDALPAGVEVEVEGPFGVFLFKYAEPRIAFLTGGIGITPIRSMLRYLADTGGTGRIEGQELVLFYGSMTEDGIVYREELDEYVGKIQGLRVIPVIANPTEPWTGHGGFITADILSAELSDPLSYTYYIVGPPPMVAAMQKIMEALAVPAGQIMIEGFAGYVT